MVKVKERVVVAVHPTYPPQASLFLSSKRIEETALLATAGGLAVASSASDQANQGTGSRLVPQRN